MKKIIAIAGFFGIFVSSAMISFAGYFNPTPLNHCDVRITQTLQRGDESRDVYILQTLLQNAGFLNASPNAYFGYQTQNAVRSFQANNGIAPTGIVGQATLNAVNERLCDTDLVDNTRYSYGSYDSYGYGYSSGVTYVAENDPYVRVISPQVASPALYSSPQSYSLSSPVYSSSNAVIASPVISNQTGSILNPLSSITPATTINSVSGTGIVYNPASGYSYGITPQSGSVTVTSPVVNAIYQEGDTVFVNWTTSNLSVSAFTISLESDISGQKKIISTATGNSFSFVLTKDLLDAVCSGVCNNSQNGSFKIVVSTPSVDIAGNTSTLRAAVAPITIKRPLGVGQVSITTSKTPVDSGEIFKLFVNIPSDTITNNISGGTYSIRVTALCPVGVVATVAGNVCGQEFAMPFTSLGTNQQQEIPAAISNTTWFKQNVTFRVNVVDLFGRVIGTADAVVTANGKVINW